MRKILAFLRWEFKGCTKSVSFWGALSSTLGLVMAVFQCPQPYPAVFLLGGLGLTLGDLVYSWFKFRVAMYKMEQERIAVTLKGQ